MKIFAIFKSQDLEHVNAMIKKIKEENENVEFVNVERTKEWKKLSKKRIKKTDLVIYFAGLVYNDNIDWEIKCAQEFGHKIHCIKINKDIELKRCFLRSKNIENPVSLEEMCAYINGIPFPMNNEDWFSSETHYEDALLEQYKILISNTETQIDRRQKITTTYLSILSILLSIITAMLSFSVWYTACGALIISITSIFLCINWRRTIKSYGKSNTAKFCVLEEIEYKLPVRMLAAEWEMLNNEKSKYKTFTNRETAVPKIFMIIYLILSVLACALIVYEHFN